MLGDEKIMTNERKREEKQKLLLERLQEMSYFEGCKGRSENRDGYRAHLDWSAGGSGNASGFRLFDLLGTLLGPLTESAGLPAQLMPLLVVKIFSSSAATGLVLDIFRTSGPDSYAGMLTSILMSCTETVFYTMSVYFLAAKVTKTRYTLTGALLATLAGTVASVVLARWMM